MRNGRWPLSLIALAITACGGSSSNNSSGSARTGEAGAADSNGNSGGSAGSSGGSSSGDDSLSESGTSEAGSLDGATSTPDSGDTGGVWRPFDATSPWNTPIAAGAALDPGSSAMIADFSTIPGTGLQTFWINIQSYSIPVYWVDSTTTPKVTVTAMYGGTGFRTGAANDSAQGGTGQVPIPAGATPAAGSDMHMAVIDKTAGIEWGMWDAVNNGNGTWSAGTAATMDVTGSGVRPPLSQSPWWAGAGPRACGYAAIAGLITAQEVKAGSIEHALIVAYPHIEADYYTPPASSAQGPVSGESTSTRGIPCGGQIQLDPTLDITTLGLSQYGLMMARTLQKYGAFVGDYSGAISLYAEADSDAQAYWQSIGLMNAEAAKIPLDRFQVLKLGTEYDENL